MKTYTNFVADDRITLRGITLPAVPGVDLGAKPSLQAGAKVTYMPATVHKTVRPKDAPEPEPQQFKRYVKPMVGEDPQDWMRRDWQAEVKAASGKLKSLSGNTVTFSNHLSAQMAGRAGALSRRAKVEADRAKRFGRILTILGDSGATASRIARETEKNLRYIHALMRDMIAHGIVYKDGHNNSPLTVYKRVEK